MIPPDSLPGLSEEALAAAVALRQTEVAEGPPLRAYAVPRLLELAQLTNEKARRLKEWQDGAAFATAEDLAEAVETADAALASAVATLGAADTAVASAAASSLASAVSTLNAAIGVVSAARAATQADLDIAEATLAGVAATVAGRGVVFEAEDNATGQTVAASTFTRIGFGTIVADPAGGWSAGNKWWTVPQTGSYSVLGTLRMPDGVTAGQSCGLGVETADSGDHFWWETSNGNRHTIPTQRVGTFAAGDHIRLAAYLELSGSAALQFASLTITRL